LIALHPLKEKKNSIFLFYIICFSPFQYPFHLKKEVYIKKLDFCKQKNENVKLCLSLYKIFFVFSFFIKKSFDYLV
jgi:hypothetical protein